MARPINVIILLLVAISVVFNPDQPTLQAETSVLQIIKRIPLDGAPSSLAVNPSLNRIYVANSDGISVIDGKTNEIITKVPCDRTPNPILVNTTTNRYYAGHCVTLPNLASPSRPITSIDGISNTIMETVDLYKSLANKAGINGFALNSITNRLYLTQGASFESPNETSQINVFDAGTFELLTTIPTSGKPSKPVVNEKTNFLYIYHREGDEIRKLNGSTNTIESFLSRVKVTAMAIDQINNRLYYTSPYPSNHQVYMHGLDGAAGTWTSPWLERATGQVAINSARNAVYAITYSPDSPPMLERFDLQTNAVSQLRLDYRDGGAMVVNPSTNSIYLTSRTGVIVIQDGVTTLPQMEDTDQDGLYDEWEEHGYDYNNDGVIDVNLPAMGARKDHKDVFVYVDWLGDKSHTHDPRQGVLYDPLNEVRKAFAEAPVTTNPDGKPGINLHIIYGRQIPETATSRELGTVVQQEGRCYYQWKEFDELKGQNFTQEKHPIFHYVIFGHQLPTVPCQGQRPIGVAKQPEGGMNESDFIVALGDWESNPAGFLVIGKARAGTFMHELGHNFGLGEGGLKYDATDNLVADHIAFKPNHLSVMNYSFMTRGLRKRGILGLMWDGTIDYSRFSSENLPDINESDLRESDDLKGDRATDKYGTRFYCSGTHKSKDVDSLQSPVDWNCDHDQKDSGLVGSINRDSNLDTLTSINEWQNLKLKGGAIGGLGIQIPGEDETLLDEPILSVELDQQIGPYNPEPVPFVYMPLIQGAP